MVEPAEKILALLNRGFDFGLQTVEGSECSVNPFPVIKPTNNLIMLDLTSEQYVQLVSSILVGAEWAYPDQSHQILWNFIKSVHCPPIMTEQECFEYPTYASFVTYLPKNPYVEPDTVPEGYLIPPFQVNGQNGVDYPDYEPLDVITPFGAFEFLGNWFDLIDGFLPQIKIVVDGAGKVYVKLLTQFNGGLAIITLDAPPNLIDIFGGIVTGGDNILDLNLDTVSLPPETAQEVIYELDIVGAGLHTIYVTFLPVIDDASIPLRYGGGFRGVQLCNFVEQPAMGIENIRFDEASCELQTLVEGEWVIVSGWENWLNCVPSGGGGGGTAAITVNTFRTTLGANYTNATTTFTNVFGFLYTPTRANMIIFCSNVNVFASGGSVRSAIALKFDGNFGDELTEPTMTGGNGASGVDMTVTDVWTGITPGVAGYINLYARSQTVGTTTISAISDLLFTIIEFDNAEDLFVEDIRIVDEELQKKIGGVWITVSDSLKTLFDAVQATANSALANANSAIATNETQASQIAAIITTNTAQAAQITALDVRVDNLEADMSDVQLSVGQLSTDVEVLSRSGVWAQTFDFSASNNGFAGDWASDAGMLINAGDSSISKAYNILHNQISHVCIYCHSYFGALPRIFTWYMSQGSDVPAQGRCINDTQIFKNWYRVKNQDIGLATFQLNFSMISGAFSINRIDVLGRGENPF